MCSQHSSRRFFVLIGMIGLVVFLAISGLRPSVPAEAQAGVRFAVIGDYGVDTSDEAAVAAMIKSWNPDFIITVGDNNYPSGEASTIDRQVGQYFHEYIYPYTGSYGAGATFNRFFPTLGNHDWDSPGAAPYLAYFTLPGNERYYDFVQGPVHFFAIDSDPREPDGATSISTQATWLSNALANSTSTWNLVYFHHPPYSSGESHGDSYWMQWPFQAWGASAVLSGHDHDYEKIVLNGLPYFVVGLGGRDIGTFPAAYVPGSEAHYNEAHGAMLVDATTTEITFSFYSIAGGGTLIDSYSLQNTISVPVEPPSSGSTGSGTTPSGSTSAAAAPLTTPLCADISGYTNAIIRADVPGGTVSNGSVFCRVIAENGTFVQNPAEIGNMDVLNQGVIQAVDVFGLTHDGVSVAGFNSSVKVCLQGSGRFFFLDATTQPRALSQLPTTPENGYTCAFIPNAGTVALAP